MNCAVGYQDHLLAQKRHNDILRAEHHAELMAHLERVPVIRAWNYVTSRISRTVSHHSDLKLQSRLSQITYLLAFWRRRRAGDYGYLEAIDIMEEEKEFWETLHQSRQEARA